MIKTLICPECTYENPGIRELGYTLPWTCNRCAYIWRLTDLLLLKPLDPDIAKILMANLDKLYIEDPEEPAP